MIALWFDALFAAVLPELCEWEFEDGSFRSHGYIGLGTEEGKGWNWSVAEVVVRETYGRKVQPLSARWIFSSVISCRKAWVRV